MPHQPVQYNQGAIQNSSILFGKLNQTCWHSAAVTIQLQARSDVKRSPDSNLQMWVHCYHHYETTIWKNKRFLFLYWLLQRWVLPSDFGVVVKYLNDVIQALDMVKKQYTMYSNHYSKIWCQLNVVHPSSIKVGVYNFTMKELLQLQPWTALGFSVTWTWNQNYKLVLHKSL